MLRYKYALVYVLIVIAFMGHYVVAKTYTEPYPSLVFPAFSEVAEVGKTFVIPKFEMYAIDNNADTFAVAPGAVLGIPKTTQARKAMSTLVKRHTLQSPAMVNARARFLKSVSNNLSSIYPGKAVRALLIVERIQYVDQHNPAKVQYKTKKSTIIVL